jgi:hypothetical protein
VKVCVHQPRYDRSAFQVKNLGVWTRQFHDVGVVADCGDSVAGNGDGLRMEKFLSTVRTFALWKIKLGALACCATNQHVANSIQPISRTDLAANLAVDWLDIVFLLCGER